MPEIAAWKIAAEASIAPLVGLLERELLSVGITPPARTPTTVRQFALWYLDAVQLLERHCAAEEDHPSMTRAEVELMCRTALSARSLREAIQLCVQFSNMLSPRAGHLRLVIRKPGVSFRLDTPWTNPTMANSLVDITGLFAFRQLFEWLVGTELRLERVGIGPVERMDVLPFLTLFGAPVLQGGRYYTLDFASDTLDLPVTRTPREFETFFRVFPCGIFEDTCRPLNEKVASIVSASLQQGAGVPTQIQIAAGLGIPLSTFRHQLLSLGTSFRKIREQCVQQAAAQFLGREDIPIADVSALLGFSDPGSFRRSFRRWAGMSPSEWKQTHRTRGQVLRTRGQVLI